MLRALVTSHCPAFGECSHRLRKRTSPHEHRDRASSTGPADCFGVAVCTCAPLLHYERIGPLQLHYAQQTIMPSILTFQHVRQPNVAGPTCARERSRARQRLTSMEGACNVMDLPRRRSRIRSLMTQVCCMPLNGSHYGSRQSRLPCPLGDITVDMHSQISLRLMLSCAAALAAGTGQHGIC